MAAVVVDSKVNEKIKPLSLFSAATAAFNDKGLESWMKYGLNLPPQQW